LPWHNTLTVFGSYVDARADFASVAPGTSSKGLSYQASMRYSSPLPVIGKYQHEVSGGFDFKRSNNNFEFGGTTSLPSDTHVLQAELGYSGLVPDKFGQTSFGLEGYYSPGDLTDNNTDSHFNQLRQGAKANYLYGRLTAQRVTRLPYDFTLVIRGTAQASNERLLPSEQLGVGGYNTVRGYEERLANGDEGWIVNTELRTPAIRLPGLYRSPTIEPDYLQFLVFFDYGAIHTIDRVVGDPKDASLSSVGAGVRFTVSKNLTARFDYGYQLTDRELSTKHSRAHVGVVASF
jgi:hemolysin activation/secretion protein